MKKQNNFTIENTSMLTGPHKDFESIKKIDQNGVEYWEARKLMVLMGYIEWRKFDHALKRAEKACVMSGQELSDHFVGVDKMIKIAKNTQKEALRSIKVGWDWD